MMVDKMVDLLAGRTAGCLADHLDSYSVELKADMMEYSTAVTMAKWMAAMKVEKRDDLLAGWKVDLRVDLRAEQLDG